MRPIEAVPALFILALAAGVFFGTAGLNYWDGATPGARFFPAALALAGTAVALAPSLGAGAGGRAGRGRAARTGMARCGSGATLAALVALAAGVPRVGFVPMLALFVLGVLAPHPAAAACAFGRHRRDRGGFVHVVFVRWLAVPLPMPFGL